jgi:hypothetical protein
MWTNDLLSDNTVGQVIADYTHRTPFLAIAIIYIVMPNTHGFGLMTE